TGAGRRAAAAGSAWWCSSGGGQRELFPGAREDVLDGETEALLQLAEGRRGAEPPHADARAAAADPALPAEAGGLLDGHARADLGRQHLVAVGLALLGEELPAGDADHPGGGA